MRPVRYQPVRIVQLMDLVVADISEPEARLWEIYEWQHTHRMTTAKALTGVAVTILVGLVAALVRGEVKISVVQAGLLIVAVIVIGGIGLFRYSRLSNLHIEYLASMRVLGDLKRMHPFLIQYKRQR